MKQFKMNQFVLFLNPFRWFRNSAVVLFATITLSANAQVELVSGGSLNAYTLSFPGVFSYTNGISVTFKSNFANTGSCTIDVNSLGAKQIRKQASAALVADDIKSGQVVTLVYDGTNFQITSLLGNAGGGVAQTLSINSDTLSISGGNSVVLPAGISSGWNTTGNSATNGNTNFIGNIDNQKLTFKTNNTREMQLFSGGDWLLGDSMQNVGLKTFYNASKSAFRTGALHTESIFGVTIFNGTKYWDTDSLGTYSFASGRSTRARGSYSFAANDKTVARGTGSAAFGIATDANGSYSFASNSNTTANGAYSSSWGNSTKANGYASMVIGQYNDTIVASETSTQPTTPLFIIGNGISSAPSNALVVRNDGNIGVGTSAPASKLHIVADTSWTGFTLADGSQGANKILTSDASGNASWQTSNAGNWSITGNTGTNANQNFIGTTDAQNLVFKTNNTREMQLFSGGNWLLGDSMQGTGNKAFFDTGKRAFRAGGLHYEEIFGLVIFEGRTRWDNSNLGTYSFAAGRSTKASGSYSLAIGDKAEATATGSVALGSSTNAFGTSSMAVNNTSTANGVNTFAAGLSTDANGANSASLGSYTDANGYSSMVIGQFNDTIVAPETSIQPTTPLFIIGNGTSSTARSNAMVVRNDGNVGLGTSTPSSKLHVVASTPATGFTLVDGSQAAGKILTTDANGNASWQVNTGATYFAIRDSAWSRKGNPGTNPNIDFIGTTDNQNLVFKTNNWRRMQLLNNGNWLVGDSMQGGGAKTFFSTSKRAFRTGYLVDPGTFFADGRTYWDSVNLGSYSFASGYNTRAQGSYSMATGFYTDAPGSYAVAMGISTNANGSGSMAINSSTTSGGLYSFSTGGSTFANGSYTSSFGYSTKANGYASMVVGYYNDTIVGPETAIQTTTPLFIVGNGTSSTARSNALVVRNDGNIGVGTSAPATKLHIAASSAGTGFRLTDGSQGANKILTSDASGNASWQTGSVNNWNILGNTGTTPISNFIGTTDNQKLVFKTNNTREMQLFGGGDWLLGDSMQGAGTKTFYSSSKGAFRTGRVYEETFLGFTILDGSKYWDLDSIGSYSFASGSNTRATGSYTLASGKNSKAHGIYSVATGYSSDAIGSAAFSANYSTLANSSNSFAAGNGSKTYGANAASFGNSTQANGFSSMVIGQFNDTIVAAETAIQPTSPLFIVGNGTSSTVRTNAMVVRNDGNVGLGVSAPTQRLHVKGQVRVDTLTTSASATDSVVMAGTDGVLRKRAGSDLIADVQTLSVSNDTLYILRGNSVVLPGSASSVWGLNGNPGTSDAINFIGTTDSTNLSFKTNNIRRMQLFAGGDWLLGDSMQGGGTGPIGSKAFFDKSSRAFRAGYLDNTGANYWNSDSLGSASFASGQNTRAQGTNSFAANNATKATGSSSFAIGENSTASGPASTATGQGTTASGWGALTSGHFTSATSRGTFATGLSSAANGLFSAAMGSNTIASGGNSLSTGASTIANGANSLTAGASTIANAANSAAIGIGSKSNGYASLVTGQYNDTIVASQASITSTTPLLLVGNGTSSTVRKNALAVFNDGKVSMGSTASTAPTHWLTVNNGTSVGTYTTTGWVHSSDARLKTDIKPIGSALEMVSKLNGVYFQWKNNREAGRQVGFLAQDVRKILPEVVTGSEGDIEKGETLGMAYQNMVPVLVEAIKELKTEVENLKKENELLKANEAKSAVLGYQTTYTKTKTITVNDLQKEMDELRQQILDLKKTNSK